MTEKKCIDWKTDVARFEAYLREQESAEATVSKYLRDIRTFMTFVREQAWIEKNDILRYKDWLMEHYSVSSANSMIVALNQFLIFMEAGRMRVRRIRVQAQSFCSAERELEKEEFRRLVCRARAGGHAQLAMLMETICATGIRVSELKFFQAGSVRTGAVRVWNKGKYRIVLLPEKLRKKLLAYMAKYGIESGPLFCTRSGKAKDRSNIWREMKSLAAGAGVRPEKVFPHNLRHLFARTFYRTTKNLVHLADILGHSSLEVTRIYTGDGIREWRKSLESLDLIDGWQ